MSSIIYTKNELPIFFIPKICFVTNGREVLTEFMQIKIIARKFKFHNFVFYMLNKIIQCLDQSFFVVIGYTIFKGFAHPSCLLGFNTSIIPQESGVMI